MKPIFNTGSSADASTLDPSDNRPEPSAEDKLKVDNSVIINRTRLQPCDKVISLYTLGDKNMYNEPAEDCERYCLKVFNVGIATNSVNHRPFVVVPIPGSNLILVVFDALECPVARMPSATYEKISIVPKEEEHGNESLACFRQTDPLPRRRPLSCINHHVNVSSTLSSYFIRCSQ